MPTHAAMPPAWPNDVVAPFPHPRDRRLIASFERRELNRILDLYGRMVAAGHWRDYAMSFSPEAAVFAAFRRSAERPELRIEKRPALRLKQGEFTLFGEHGQALKRGHDLGLVLAPVERRLIRLVGP